MNADKFTHIRLPVKPRDDLWSHRSLGSPPRLVRRNQGVGAPSDSETYGVPTTSRSIATISRSIRRAKLDASLLRHRVELGDERFAILVEGVGHEPERGSDGVLKSPAFGPVALARLTPLSRLGQIRKRPLGVQPGDSLFAGPKVESQGTLCGDLVESEPG